MTNGGRARSAGRTWWLRAARAARHPVRTALRLRASVGRELRRLRPRDRLEPLLGIMAGPLLERSLARRIRRERPPAADPGSAPLVSLVFAPESPAGLEVLLGSVLADTDYPRLEVVVGVHPGAASEVPAAANGVHHQVRVAVAAEPTRSSALNAAAAAATGELLLVLTQAVRPIRRDWLRMLVETAVARAPAAVTPRLVAPARGSVTADGFRVPGLTLAEAGYRISRSGGVAHGVPITGPDPTGEAGRAVRGVSALGLACLLAPRAAVLGVGGFAPDDLDGQAGIDLSVRLRQAGITCWCDGRAALWLLPGPTPSVRPDGGSASAERRLAARSGPLLNRVELADRLRGRAAPEPLRVGITVTSADERDGYGDWYTAHELGDALAALGAEIAYLPRKRDAWYTIELETDVIVSLVDAFDARRAPPHVVALAWVRNWTDRWLERPWFHRFDIALASSARSEALIAEQSSVPVMLFPIATNPNRFSPSGPLFGGAPFDVAFTGNRWGEERGVEAGLAALADRGVRTAVFGRGWSTIERLRQLDRGPQPYAALPGIYRSARLVVDDAASPTAPYGSLNSRVFDALATGTLVLTNNAPGVRELFDDDFPVWDRPDDLVTVAVQHLADDERRDTLAHRYRDMVLTAHTYGRRALQLRDLLLDWLRRPSAALVDVTPGTDALDPLLVRLARHLVELGWRARIYAPADRVAAADGREDVVVHVLRDGSPPGPDTDATVLLVAKADARGSGVGSRYAAVLAWSDVVTGNQARPRQTGSPGTHGLDDILRALAGRHGPPAAT